MDGDRKATVPEGIQDGLGESGYAPNELGEPKCCELNPKDGPGVRLGFGVRRSGESGWGVVGLGRWSCERLDELDESSAVESRVSDAELLVVRALAANPLSGCALPAASPSSTPLPPSSSPPSPPWCADVAPLTFHLTLNLALTSGTCASSWRVMVAMV